MLKASLIQTRLQFFADLVFAIDDVAGLAGQQSDKLSRSIEANWMLDAIEGK